MRTLKLVFTRVLEWMVAAIVAFLVLVVLWGVVSRFAIQLPSRWTEELATQLLVWVAMLGAAVAFSRREHLGVDYLHAKLHPEAQRLLSILIQGLVIVFAGCVMVGGGCVLVSKTWASGQVTPALGIRMGLVYLSVPISGLFIVFFAIEQMIELVQQRPWKEP
jgi:TRAP-type C4-dicarboxylate transport system permease small subunit